MAIKQYTARATVAGISAAETSNQRDLPRIARTQRLFSLRTLLTPPEMLNEASIEEVFRELKAISFFLPEDPSEPIALSDSDRGLVAVGNRFMHGPSTDPAVKNFWEKWKTSPEARAELVADLIGWMLSPETAPAKPPEDAPKAAPHNARLFPDPRIATVLRRAGGQSPEFWRSLSVEWEALSKLQRETLKQATHPEWMMAYHSVESDRCTLAGGAGVENLTSRIREILVRGANGLGRRADEDASDFWIRALHQDLVQDSEQNIRFEGSNGIIPGFIASSLGMCLRLAARAEEQKVSGQRVVSGFQQRDVRNAREEPGASEPLHVDIAYPEGLPELAEFSVHGGRSGVLHAEQPNLAAGTPRAYAFQQSEGGWQVSFDGQTARLDNLAGVKHIAELLRKPRATIEAVKLAGVDAETTGILQSSALPVADEQTIRVVQKALEERRSEVSLESNLEKREGIREEIKKLEKYLRGAGGHLGQPRMVSGSAERARKAVSIAINRAFKHISEKLPALAAHLEASIATGTALTYNPSELPDWQF